MFEPGARNVATAILFTLLVGCSDHNDNRPALESPVPNPQVTGPVSGGGSDNCCVLNFAGLEVDLRDQGYVPGTPFYAGLNYPGSTLGYRETEYFLSGHASAYTNTTELTGDGHWGAQQAEAAPFTTRIVVQRPQDPARFNGTVVVEWFNVSGGLDAAPDWIQGHTELMREGYVWVGVSAQAAGVEGGGPFGLPLKTVDTERYAELSHPGDSYSYDIFSQAAQSVRHPVGVAPLDGLQVRRMIAVGESQSAFRLVTYVNAVHPLVNLFDAFLIHSRGAGAAGLSQEPQPEIAAPGTVFIRTDLDVPVLTLQTETDLFRLNSIAARQPDTDYLRLWEVAGSAHSDVYTTVKGPLDRGDDPSVAAVTLNSDARPPFISCAIPVNDGPGHWVLKAAIAALELWLRQGVPAANAARLAVNEQGTGFAYDAQGNVAGGIRTPYVDAPLARLSGEGQPPASPFCGLFGTTDLLADDVLTELYPQARDYLNAVELSLERAGQAGFLRPADVALIRSQAEIDAAGL